MKLKKCRNQNVEEKKCARKRKIHPEERERKNEKERERDNRISGRWETMKRREGGK